MSSAGIALPFPLPGSQLPFVPWHLPHLAHTAHWEELDAAERLTCNRLMGLLINEIFLLIEHRLILAVLGGLQVRSAGTHPRLARTIAATMAEERRHLGWFTAFAAVADPDGGPMVCLSPLIRRTLEQLASSAVGRGVGLWIMLATEEWATRFANQLIAAEAATPGSFDPAYLALHRAHLMDERRHVAIDHRLLRHAQGDQGSAVRVLGLAMRLVLVPRRGIRRLIERLIERHPRLAPRRRSLIAEARAVGASAGYWRQVMGNEGLPIVSALARRFVDGDDLALMPGIGIGASS